MTSISKPSDNGESTAETDPADRITPSAAAFDPFDPASLRLSQDFGATLGVKKVLTRVPIDKPAKNAFFRVRAGEDWRLQTATLEVQGGGVGKEIYLVSPALWSDLSTEISPTCLFLYITRQNNLGLWPCKLPDPNARRCLWHDSALDAARIAETRWIRVRANMEAGMYDIHEAGGDLAEPTWPDLSFHEILKLAFKDRFIQSHDHPVLRSLRGEV